MDTATIPPKPEMTIESVGAQIVEERGNMSAVARHFQVQRTRLMDFVNIHPELAAIRNDCREAIVDKAEDNIFKAVESGDGFSSRFVAATLGKDRGWVPREEKTGKDGADLLPPTITITTYKPEAEDAPADDA